MVVDLVVFLRLQRVSLKVTPSLLSLSFSQGLPSTHFQNHRRGGLKHAVRAGGGNMEIIMFLKEENKRL